MHSRKMARWAFTPPLTEGKRNKWPCAHGLSSVFRKGGHWILRLEASMNKSSDYIYFCSYGLNVQNS